jgi:hypothetical protein
MRAAVHFTTHARVGFAFQWQVWLNSKYNCRSPGAQGSHPIVLLDRTENFLAGLANYLGQERKLKWGGESFIIASAAGENYGGLW